MNLSQCRTYRVPPAPEITPVSNCCRQNSHLCSTNLAPADVKLVDLHLCYFLHCRMASRNFRGRSCVPPAWDHLDLRTCEAEDMASITVLARASCPGAQDRPSAVARHPCDDLAGPIPLVLPLRPTFLSAADSAKPAIGPGKLSSTGRNLGPCRTLQLSAEPAAERASSSAQRSCFRATARCRLKKKKKKVLTARAFHGLAIMSALLKKNFFFFFHNGNSHAGVPPQCAPLLRAPPLDFSPFHESLRFISPQASHGQSSFSVAPNLATCWAIHHAQFSFHFIAPCGA